MYLSQIPQSSKSAWHYNSFPVLADEMGWPWLNTVKSLIFCGGTTTVFSKLACRAISGLNLRTFTRTTVSLESFPSSTFHVHCTNIHGVHDLQNCTYGSMALRIRVRGSLEQPLGPILTVKMDFVERIPAQLLQGASSDEPVAQKGALNVALWNALRMQFILCRLVNHVSMLQLLHDIIFPRFEMPHSIK